MASKIPDIMWPTYVFAWLTGAPSVLSILESALAYEFTPILSWMMDGYQRLAKVAGDLIGSVVFPVLRQFFELLEIHAQVEEFWSYPLVIVLAIHATINRQMFVLGLRRQALFCSLLGTPLIILGMAFGFTVTYPIDTALLYHNVPKIPPRTIVDLPYLGPGLLVVAIGISASSYLPRSLKVDGVYGSGDTSIPFFLAGLLISIDRFNSLVQPYGVLFTVAVAFVPIAIFYSFARKVYANKKFGGKKYLRMHHGQADFRIAFAVLGIFVTAFLILGTDWLVQIIF